MKHFCQKKISVFGICIMLVTVVNNRVCAQHTKKAKEPELTSFVDPMIGAGGHGHVFVGASVPFGAVQVGPDNHYKGWDWSRCKGLFESSSSKRMAFG